MKYTEAYHGIVAIQRKLLDDAMSGDTTASARAQVGRAYTDLEQMKRIMRGKANPKPVDVAVTSRSNARRAGTVRPASREQATPNTAAHAVCASSPPQPEQPPQPEPQQPQVQSQQLAIESPVPS